MPSARVALDNWWLYDQVGVVLAMTSPNFILVVRSEVISFLQQSFEFFFKVFHHGVAHHDLARAINEEVGG